MSSPQPAIAKHRLPIALLVLVAASIYAVTGLTHQPLAAPDEIRVAEVARRMSATGDVVVPELAGVPFLEYPPLYYVAVAAAFKLFGVSDAVARLPSALATIATLMLAFDLGRRVAGTRAGVLAAAVLASMVGFSRYGHDCMVDSWLALFVAAGTWAYARLLLDEERPERSSPSPWLMLCLYLSAVLAFLVKGPIGPLLLGLPVIAHALLARRRALLLSRLHLIGLPLFLAACAAWPALLYFRDSHAAFDEWWYQNVLGRFAPEDDYIGGHVNGPLFYLTSFPGLALPYSLALPFVIHWLVKQRTDGNDPRQLACRRTVLFLATTAPVGLALLSAAATKRGVYALPLLTPLAVLSGAWIESAAATLRRRLEQAAGAIFGVSLIALFVGSLVVYQDRDLTPMVTDLASMHVLEDLRGFQLSERVRAVVPFRSGVVLTDIREVSELQQLVERQPDVKLLIEDNSMEVLPPAFASRLQPIREWKFGRHLFGLYTVAAP